MRKNKKIEQEQAIQSENMQGVLNKNAKTIKDLIAPAGIDASNTNHLEIVSNRSRFARSMVVSTIPRMCTNGQRRY